MLIKIAKFALRILPYELAIYVVRFVAARTQRAHLSPDEEAAMLLSCKMHYGKDNRNVAWVWGQGPLIIFVHGWGGRAAQFECTWQELQSGWAYANAGPDTLLFYDEADKFVNHSEGDKLMAVCPGAELVKTRGHNHQQILAAPELASTLGVFLLKTSKV